MAHLLIIQDFHPAQLCPVDEIVDSSDGDDPGMGAYKAVAVMSFDKKEGGYSYDEYTSIGQHNVSNGSLEGETWSWTSTQDMYTYKYEGSRDGNGWTTVLDGKATKIKT